MLMRYSTFQHQQGFQTTILISKIATQPSKQLHDICNKLNHNPKLIFYQTNMYREIIILGKYGTFIFLL